MDNELRYCRSLYSTLLNAAHEARPVLPILLEWIKSDPPVLPIFARLGKVDGADFPAASHDDLHELYAFSRVHDVLLLTFQKPGQGEYGLSGKPPDLSMADYRTWMTQLGFRELSNAIYHPFFHEIAGLIEAPDPDAPVELVEERWPGYFAENLLVSRAGWIVRAGRNVLTPGVAERSTLYWSYLRNERPTEDLSLGWGSNSQWATSFRRDYFVNGRLSYNVDGEFDVVQPSELFRQSSGTREDLSLPERIEIVTARTFLQEVKQGVEVYLWDDFFQEAWPPATEPNVSADLVERFYPGGAKKAEFQFQKGLLHGVQRTFSADGRVTRECECRAGVKHGDERSYFANGQIREQLQFVGGVETAPRQEFREDGSLDEESVWEDGRLKASSFFDQDGRLRETCEYRNHRIHGQRTIFAGGKRKNEYTYVDGVAHGPAREYAEDGTLLWTMSFENGVISGVAQNFDSTGRLVGELSYENGKRIEGSWKRFPV